MHPERIVPPSTALVVDGEVMLNPPGYIGMNQLQRYAANICLDEYSGYLNGSNLWYTGCITLKYSQ